MKTLLFFIKQFKRYRRELSTGLLLSITLVFSSIALLALSGWFISAAAFAGLSISFAAVFNYFLPASLIRLLALIRILSRYADRVINHDVTFKILSSLRVWFYESLIPLAPAHLLTHQSGDLLNRAVNDIDTLDHLYLNVLSPIFVSFFLTIAILFFTAFFSMKLALIIFIMMLSALILIPISIFSSSQKIGFSIQKQTARLRTQLVDFLQGFTDFLLFVKKEKRLVLIQNEEEELIAAQKRFSFLKGFTIGSMQLFSGITVFLVIFFGISAVQQQIINGAELAMIILMVIATFDQLLMLPFVFLSLGKTVAASNRLADVANTTPAIIFSNDQAPTQYDLHLKNITFSYPNSSAPVLNGFNLEIPQGTHFTLTGASGCGKTTIANLIARIFDPNRGDVFIGDTNLKMLSEKTLRKTVSYVTQYVHIFNASLRDNLCLFENNYSDEQLFSVLEKMELGDLVKSLPEKLNTEMGEFGKNFSGGQIRRIAIARAILQNTPILILDEPSTGLDQEMFQRIWKNCEDDFKNKTLLIILHQLENQEFTLRL